MEESQNPEGLRKYSQGAPEELNKDHEVSREHVEATLRHLLNKPKWPNIWILFSHDDNPAYRATLTPISKPKVPLQLTFWRHGEPCGDEPICTLEDGIRTAIQWGFSVPEVRQQLEHSNDLTYVAEMAI